MNKNVSIIKTNSGNIFNVAKAFEYIGSNVQLVSSKKDLLKSDYLIFPGVGAFAEGMKALENNDLNYSIKEWANKERPFLGICLGMQLLFECSEEFGFNKGLGLIKGKVNKLPESLKLKVPNITWERLYHGSPESTCHDNKDKVFKNHDFEKDLYFVHSYACYPQNNKSWLATTKYGDHNFCSVVKENNIYGFQFHPEKSGNAGLKLLEEFLKL